MQPNGTPSGGFIPSHLAAQPSFAYDKLTAEDVDLIKRNVERLRDALHSIDPFRTATEFDSQTMQMHLATLHVNGKRLKLFHLLASSHVDFMHDMMAIKRYIDVKSGTLPHEVHLLFAE